MTFFKFIIKGIGVQKKHKNFKSLLIHGKVCVVIKKSKQQFKL